MPDVTGQLFMRDMGPDEHSANPKGKRIVMVCGILSVDESQFKSETQYTVVGQAFEGLLNLTLPLDSGIDHGKEFIGNTPSGILCAPIWRV